MIKKKVKNLILNYQDAVQYDKHFANNNHKISANWQLSIWNKTKIGLNSWVVVYSKCVSRIYFLFMNSQRV